MADGDGPWGSVEPGQFDVNAGEFDADDDDEQFPGSQQQLKRARTDGGEGGWTCLKCGNFNFEGRAVCNRRTCSAPKDWAPGVAVAAPAPRARAQAGGASGGAGDGGWSCVKCGNFNFEGRAVCNRRVCSAPREESEPGLIVPAARQPFNAGGKGNFSISGCGGGDGSFNLGGCGGGGGGEDGGWSCVRCGNFNYEGRSKCNRKTCSAPREESVGGPAQLYLQQFRAGPGACSGPIVPAGGGGDTGRWTCLKCGNLNFEGRMFCNRRVCSAPREEPMRAMIAPVSRPLGPGGCRSASFPTVGGTQGPPPGAMAQGGCGNSGAAGGGWTCKECGNHNFEGRIYCNRRTCSAPGPWTCSVCGNFNFAGRTVCNRKTCSAPMPPPPAGAQPRITVGMCTPPSRLALVAPGRGPSMGPRPLTAASAQPAAQAIAMLKAAGLASLPGVAEGIKTIIASVGGAAAVQSPGAAAGNGQGGSGAGCGVQKPIQEGSWLCGDCGNINFPNRDICNRKVCSKPRMEVDAGPPPGCGASDSWA